MFTRWLCRVAAGLAALAGAAALAAPGALSSPQISTPTPTGDAATAMTASQLAPALRVGDVVFIRVKARPFREVADATGAWTNHVGVIVSRDGDQALVAESAVPWSRTTPLERFAARSEGGRLAVRRLDTPLTADQSQALQRAAAERMGVAYDTGFDLHSQRQFCSRFVREVLGQATGVEVGEVETFRTLLSRHPDAHVGFWRLWYLGRIPWDRETVTPASLWTSPRLRPVFDGPLQPPRRSRNPSPRQAAL